MGFEANARTNANGSPFSLYSSENMSTSGLGNLIKVVEKIEISHSDLAEATLTELLETPKYSMGALAMHNDFNLSMNTVVFYGSAKNVHVIQTDDGRGYKIKGSRLFKLKKGK